MRLALLVLALGGILVAGCQRSAEVTQPIKFSHNAHTEKGIPCAACHQTVENGVFASLPRTDDCMMCHSGAITDNPEEEKVRQYAEKETEIPWKVVYRMPPHVYFSHRRHVTLGGVECASCHGDVQHSTLPVTKPAVSLKMQVCIDCHTVRNASTDCNACHR